MCFFYVKKYRSVLFSYYNPSLVSASIPQRVGRAPQRVQRGRVRAAAPALPGGAHRSPAPRREGGAAGQRHRHQDRRELRLCAQELVLQVCLLFLYFCFYVLF